jgi:trehalose utilization protein
MHSPLRVLIWGEYRHEKTNPKVGALYPDGMHEAIAAGLRGPNDVVVATTTLDEPEHGLTDEVLENTDVLVWWGHKAHGEVRDDIAAKVQQRVLAGMGLIVLHSGHVAKPFTLLMGTSCALKWRESSDKERLWNVNPSHPIAAGIGDYFELPREEMYGEPFGIPTPDELIFISWFTGGEVFRSGATWQRGHGRVFYFRPGHETYPTYYDENVRKVIANAVRWARPRVTIADVCFNAPPLEPLPEDPDAAVRSEESFT